MPGKKAVNLSKSREDLLKFIEDDDEEMILAFLPLASHYYLKYIDKEPMHSDCGQGWRQIRELIYGRGLKCHETIKMSPTVFLRLCDALERNYGLKGTRNMTIQESVAMFLHTIAHNCTEEYICCRFSQSRETVGRKFHEVLNALVQMATEILKPNTQALSQVHPKLRSDHRYWPYFKGCVGAIDGIHVPVKVSREGVIRYTNRHGEASMNVLAICNMDMLFTYAYIGIPGSVYDARVLSLAEEFDDTFPTPPIGKYYVADFGYADRPGYLIPYRKTNYHPSTWRHGYSPITSKEMFNKYHSSLRSVIEKTFGIWKGKWQVLRDMPRYRFSTQKKVVAATMALHNFIRLSKLGDQDFEQLEMSEFYSVTSNLDDDTSDSDDPDEDSTSDMELIRDEIASQIWSSHS